MNNTTIGDRIKYHRKRLGMTQEQLAERMGVSAQAVSKWENNLSCPDISVLPELAEVFGISVDELLGKTDSTPAKEAEVVDEDKDKGISVQWNWSAKSGSICFALYILTVGVLLLLRGFIPAMDISWWTIVWTTALVYIGVSGIIGGFSLFCLAMALAGIYFLLSAYELLLSGTTGTAIPSDTPPTAPTTQTPPSVTEDTAPTATLPDITRSTAAAGTTASHSAAPVSGGLRTVAWVAGGLSAASVIAALVLVILRRKT